MNKKLISLVFLVLVLVAVLAGPTLALADDLDGAFKAFTQGSQSAGNSAVVSPIMGLLGTIAVWVAWVLVSAAIVFLLINLFDVVSGKTDLKAKKGYFIGAFVVLVVGVLTVTGGWGTVFSFIGKIVHALLGGLGSSGTTPTQ